jgi:hypothetical protein
VPCSKQGNYARCELHGECAGHLFLLDQIGNRNGYEVPSAWRNWNKRESTRARKKLLNPLAPEKLYVTKVDGEFSNLGSFKLCFLCVFYNIFLFLGYLLYLHLFPLQARSFLF